MLFRSYFHTEILEKKPEVKQVSHDCSGKYVLIKGPFAETITQVAFSDLERAAQGSDNPNIQSF